MSTCLSVPVTLVHLFVFKTYTWTCLWYLDLQKARQLQGLVVSVTASCIGDKDNWKTEVVVYVQKLSESSTSCGDD